MLADIDLKSASEEEAESGAKTKKSASTSDNDNDNDDNDDNDDQQHTATIPPSQSQERSTSRRMTLRGKPSYHFHMKRPRRNVKKRSIAAQLQNIEEHKEMLMGMDMTQQHQQRRDGRGHDDRDQFRAPRVALVLFLLVCTAGGYRGFSQYWVARNAAASAIRVARIEGGEDVARSFFRRAGEDDEHREAVLLAADGLEGILGSGENVTDTEENIEDIPTLLFDETIEAPQDLFNLVNIFREQYNPNMNKLFLWHIPRTGTTTMKRIASYCMGLTIASEAGKTEMARGGGGGGDSTNQELRIVEGLDGVTFATVDLSNPDGIAIAKSLNVGLSDRVDLISSPYLWDTAGIFDGYHKGYMLAMFRHPIERATSLYFSMRKNPQYEKQVASLSSIEQYAKSSLVENNWMTRFLSNTLSGELTPQHEAIAKEILRTKCLIGLLRDKTETMRRLEVLFNLKAKEKRSKRREECQEKLLYWDWPGKNRHEPVVGGEAWDILYKHNTFDLRLYEYAEKLFKAQGKLFQDSPSAW